MCAEDSVQSVEVVVTVISNIGGTEGAQSPLTPFKAIPNKHTIHDSVSRQVSSPSPKHVARFMEILESSLINIDTHISQ